MMHKDAAYLLIGIPDGVDVDSHEVSYHDKYTNGKESFIEVNFEMVADRGRLEHPQDVDV